MLMDKTLFDYDGVITYVGTAAPGVKESDPRWVIVRIEHDASNKPINITRAGGTKQQVYSWNDRKTLEYK